jgi:hypothetical protein
LYASRILCGRVQLDFDWQSIAHRANAVQVQHEGLASPHLPKSVSILCLDVAALEGKTVQLAAHVDTMSEEYKAATATANREAAAEKYFTKHDTSLVFERQGALNTEAAVTKVQKHKKISKEQFELNKDDIEGKMFDLFKDKAAWKTADVAVRSCMPRQHVHVMRKVQDVLTVARAMCSVFSS